MKKKVKEFKVCDRFLKTQNEILVEINQTLVLENERLKEEHDKLKEEHEFVCYQAFKWNKERKSRKPIRSYNFICKSKGTEELSQCNENSII